MSILFFTLIKIDSLDDRGIYHDLLREFVRNGHYVYIVCPLERRIKKSSQVIFEKNVTILQVKCFNIQKTGLIEKVASTLTISFFFKRYIEKNLKHEQIDLILYSTPPITIFNLVKWAKNRFKSKTYLLLKDIFPQNAVDLGFFKNGGPIHKYFQSLETKLYLISDRIGCMSPANQKYLLEKHPFLESKIEINPNSIELKNEVNHESSKKYFLEEYSIPSDSTIFLFSGNLGIPQGVFFLTDIIKSCEIDNPSAFFLIIGNGTEYKNLFKWFTLNRPPNAVLIDYMPKKKFDLIAELSDVGIIMLRKEFTIPNFPSRLLSYMENKIPILSITDRVSDLGVISVENNFGLWSEYGDLESVINNISFLINNSSRRNIMGDNAYNYLIENYTVKVSYNKIMDFAKFN